jgi:hypothetical protein
MYTECVRRFVLAGTFAADTAVGARNPQLPMEDVVEHTLLINRSVKACFEALVPPCLALSSWPLIPAANSISIVLLQGGIALSLQHHSFRQIE